MLELEDIFFGSCAESPAEPASVSSDSPENKAESSACGSSSADAQYDGEVFTPRKVRRRPIPRKGHTKSRNGCYNCKRRKIKCQENTPECFNCKRVGLPCEYPGSNRMVVASTSPTYALQTNPTTFNLDDMRFFQHFLITAYPPLPIDGDEAWRDVAAISHEYDFLIHSMLGLAASHLSCAGSADYGQQALAHRLSAISGLNAAMSRPNPSMADGEALFATTMALTFQSSLMHDGMLEFLAMMRGCQIVATAVMPDFTQSVFRSFARDVHIENAQMRLGKFGAPPVIDDALVEGFLLSLRALAPLCQSTLELNYLAAIERVVRLPKTDPAQAIAEFTALYTITNDLSNEDFVAFTTPDNWAAQLLFIHFLMMEYIMGESVLGPRIRAYEFRRLVTFKWLERLAEKLPVGYEKYIRWLRSFALSLLADTLSSCRHVPKIDGPVLGGVIEVE